MSWIDTVPRDRAEGRLRALYDRIAGPDGHIDNILQVHSLRPHTLEGHMTLYKAVLHHTGNRLPKWLLEALGVHVSRLNGCTYCVDHHYAGLRRLVGEVRAAAIFAELDAAAEDAAELDHAALAALRYATRLTRDPAGIGGEEVAALRAAGFDDGGILEINQVVSYFAYANRTVQGLGVTTTGDRLGLSPGTGADDADWRHG